MRNKAFTCIVCPNGCVIEAAYDGDGELTVSGQKCPRGREYVVQELTDPRRTIASTVRIQHAALPLCSVRLNRPIPKKDIFRVMEEINRLSLSAPVHIGQLAIENVCGLGADVIVTKEMDEIAQIQ